MKESNYTSSTIEKIVYFIDDVVRHIGVILIAAWSGCAQGKHLAYR